MQKLNMFPCAQNINFLVLPEFNNLKALAYSGHDSLFSVYKLYVPRELLPEAGRNMVSCLLLIHNDTL